MNSANTRLPRILGATLALGLGIFAAVPAGGAFAAPSDPGVFTPLATPPAANSFFGVPIAGLVAPTGTGAITGRVTVTGTAQETTPIVGLFAKDSGGSWTAKNTLTQTDGTYSFAGLAAGAYRIGFADSSPLSNRHATEYYNDKLTVDEAQDINVVEGGTVADINAELSYAGPVPTSRIAGATRYATSAAASDKFPVFAAGTGTVYIASGDNFPDALSAAPAAAVSGGPLLLTPTNYEPAEIANAITRLSPNRIVVVGGLNAVSADVFDAYGKLAPVIERIAGADRYETSRLIAAAAFPVPPVAPAAAQAQVSGTAGAAVVGTRKAYLATGANFPDALVASAAAGTLGEPVILVRGATDTVDADTAQLLTDLEIGHLRIAGGPVAVSAAFEASLTGAGYATERYAGVDRYDTSRLINGIFDATNTSGTVYLAVGTGYADALSGGALAAFDSSPMFITPGNCVPIAVLQTISTLQTTNVVLLGGPNALSDAVASLADCA